MEIKTWEIGYSGAEIDAAIYKLLNEIRVIKFYPPTGVSGEPLAIFIGVSNEYIKWERMNIPNGYTEFKEEGSSTVVFSSSVDYLITGDQNLIAQE